MLLVVRQPSLQVIIRTEEFVLTMKRSYTFTLWINYVGCTLFKKTEGTIGISESMYGIQLSDLNGKIELGDSETKTCF